MKEEQLVTDDKWDIRFMRLAKEIGSWSKDPSSQVGAIIVNDDRKILATGYNGFPSGIEDNQRLHNRETKYPMVIHAEANCLLNALNNGTAVKGGTIYVHKLPICSDCCKMLIQAGIKRMVIMPVDETISWVANWKNFSLPMINEVKIELSILENI